MNGRPCSEARAQRGNVGRAGSVGEACARWAQQAREAARGLALAPREAKNARAAAAAARELRAQTPAILEANARDLAAARGGRAPGCVPRPPDARSQAHRGHGQGPGGDRRPARSGRRRARAMDAAQRPRHRARARAARRHRHHLREPAERDGRCRRAVPQGRQRGDPARRLGQPSFQPRHPGLPGARPARGGPARGRHPARAHHRPRGGRPDAARASTAPST